MKITATCAGAACFALLLLMLAFPGRSAALRLEYAASQQDGFHFSYKIPLLGLGRVDLKDSSSAPKNIRLRLLFIKLATIQLSLNPVEPETQLQVLNLNYEITSRFSEQPFSGTIPVPCGQAGLRVKLFRKWFLWTGGNDADARVLLTKKQSAYKIALNFPELNGEWADNATLEKPRIQQDFFFDNMTEPFADLQLDFSYLPALFTKVQYTLNINNPLGSPDNATAPYAGDLLLPNGSYHLWYNAAQ